MGNSMMQVRRRIIMDTPHIVTPTPAELHTFSTNMVAPLKDCVIHFDPVQEGSGDASPDNVRNITGWTGVSLTRCGKNLFNLADFAAAGWTEVQDAEYPDTWTGNKQRLVFYEGKYRSGGILRKLMPLGRVAFSFYNGADNNWRIYFHYVGNDEWDNASGNIATSGLKELMSSGSNVCDGAKLYTIQGVTANGILGRVMLELGNEFTDYEPYNGQTIPVDWTDTAGMLYGGTYNPVTGELMDTWHTQALTGDEPWAEYNGEYRFACYSNNGFPNKARGQDNIICNKLDVGGYNSNYYVAVVGESADLFATATDLKAYLAEQYANGTPVVISYERAIPIVYHLPPLNLKTLRGINNIWSNANGNIELSYWTH